MRRARRAGRAVSLLALCGAASGCLVTQKEHQKLEGDVRALQTEFTSVRTSFNQSREKLLAEIAKADEKIVQVEKALADIEKFTSSRFADGYLQMEKAIADLQALHGQVEEGQHSLAEVRAQLEVVKADLEGLRIEVGAGRGPAAATTTTGNGGGPAPSPPPDDAPLPEDKEAFYQLAYDALRAGRSDRARELFESFLKKWPDDPLSDNARYWIGESFYTKGKFQNAILEFQKVVEKFPKGDKVPDALLKLGMSFSALGYCKEARPFYEELVSRHKTSPLVKAAKDRLARLDQDCKQAK